MPPCSLCSPAASWTDLVGLAKPLELGLGFWVIWVFVGVHAPRQQVVLALDLLRGGVLRDVEQRVEALAGRAGPSLIAQQLSMLWWDMRIDQDSAAARLMLACRSCASWLEQISSCARCLACLLQPLVDADTVCYLQMLTRA